MSSSSARMAKVRPHTPCVHFQTGPLSTLACKWQKPAFAMAQPAAVARMPSASRSPVHAAQLPSACDAHCRHA